MPSLNDWMGAPSNAPIQVVDEANRAVLAWRRIQDRPTDIYLKRLDPAAQTMRVEYHDLSHEEDGRVGSAGVSQATIFGIRNHPTLPDTDIDRGDRFVIAGSIFEVVALMLPPGEVQALCEVRDG